MTAVSVALALSNWKTLAMSMFDSNTLPQLECFSGFESVALDAETSSTLLQFVYTFPLHIIRIVGLFVVQRMVWICLQIPL